jgi:hypothetical protein
MTYDLEERFMGHFLALALSFPAVIYTVLLGVALVYWVFVMVGAAHVNFGDGAADAAADAALEGVAKGAIEGATKGMLEGAADHLHGADSGEVGDMSGTHTGLIAALRLRSAPATVVMSGILLFAWIFVMLGMRAVEALLPPEGIAFTIAKLALVVGAPILALLPTSLAVRPLARVFTPVKATTHGALVGKLCTIRTGTVTDRFGEATLEDGGAGVVVRVRVESGEKLRRGDPAVIVGYDAERQEFTVAPMNDLLDDEPRQRSVR